MQPENNRGQRTVSRGTPTSRRQVCEDDAQWTHKGDASEFRREPVGSRALYAKLSVSRRQK